MSLRTSSQKTSFWIFSAKLYSLIRWTWCGYFLSSGVTSKSDNSLMYNQPTYEVTTSIDSSGIVISRAASSAYCLSRAAFKKGEFSRSRSPWIVMLSDPSPDFSVMMLLV